MTKNNNTSPVIAVDAMGGDNAPQAIVQGALHAARKGIAVIVYGDQVQIEPMLYDSAKNWKQLPITIAHCSDVVAMDAMPTHSVTKQHDSSLNRMLHAVLDGHAHAAVTAGNSGAALVAGMLIYKTIDGIDRPALGKYLPTKQGTVFCLDLGVNADCKPEYLLQFALMGHAYIRTDRAVTSPRIGLLSNGHEPYKGSTLVKKAYNLLHNTPTLNFVGNVEARDIFEGHADVIVSDGFTGNIFLKTAQGTVNTLLHWLERECSKKWLYTTLFRLLGNTLLAPLYAKTDYAHQAGALLLGLQHPLIIAHGCATAQSIERSITYAHELVQHNFLKRFNNELGKAIPTTKTILSPELKQTQKFY